MKLLIDTTDQQKLRLEIADDNGRRLAKTAVPAFRKQGEKLLPSLERLLKKKGWQLEAIKAISVVNGQGSFSSLRIGIATANALAFVLGVSVVDDQGRCLKSQGLSVVEPSYTAEPNIGKIKPVDK
jgi:tRNA A37 threonylcarbamoyladenosine modification protein TsaB